MVILANAEAATEWIPEHRIALTAIRAAYKYEHEHDSSSLTAIMKELTTVDESCDRRRAPASEANAAAVGDHLGIFSGIIEEYVKTGNHGEANAVAYDTDSSDGTRRDCGRSKSRKATTRGRSSVSSPSTSRSPSRSASPPRRRKSKHRDGSRGKDRGKDKDKTKIRNKKNDCPHCAAVDPPRPKPHPSLAQSKCPWSKKYKGWRPEWICGRVGIQFKARYQFSEEMVRKVNK